MFLFVGLLSKTLNFKYKVMGKENHRAEKLPCSRGVMNNYLTGHPVDYKINSRLAVRGRSLITRGMA